MTQPHDQATAEQWLRDHGYTGQPAHKAGKRCGLKWAPWMSDWFISWSPRNGNENAEGPWDHWVDLALQILSDPLTAIVRPDVHQPGLAEKVQHLYDESARELTLIELRNRFDRREAR